MLTQLYYTEVQISNSKQFFIAEILTQRQFWSLCHCITQGKPTQFRKTPCLCNLSLSTTIKQRTSCKSFRMIYQTEVLSSCPNGSPGTLTLRNIVSKSRPICTVVQYCQQTLSIRFVSSVFNGQLADCNQRISKTLRYLLQCSTKATFGLSPSGLSSYKTGNKKISLFVLQMKAPC